MCGKRQEDRFLAGIVSTGPEVCASEFPGIYTDLTKYRAWIDEKVAKNNQYYIIPENEMKNIGTVLNISKQKAFLLSTIIFLFFSI